MGLLSQADIVRLRVLVAQLEWGCALDSVHEHVALALANYRLALLDDECDACAELCLDNGDVWDWLNLPLSRANPGG